MPTTAELKSQELFSPRQASRSVSLGQESFEPSGTGHETWVTATGATERRTLADHLAWRVNVKDFGAVGDSATDDTDALNAAFASGAYHVYIPAGGYRFSSQLTIPDYVRVEGAESTASHLICTFATGEAIIMGTSVLEHLKINHSVTRTADATLVLQGNGTIKNCEFHGYHIGLKIDGTALSRITAMIRDTLFFLPAPGLTGSGGITGAYFNNSTFDNVNIIGPFTTASPDFGIYLSNGDTVHLNNVNVVGHGIGLHVVPTAGDFISALTAVGCFFDSASNAGGTCSSVVIDPVATGTVIGLKFSSCWFGGAERHGVLLNPAGTVNGVLFEGCQFMNNTLSGLRLFGTNVTNVSVVGGQAGQNAEAGINVSAATTDFLITGLVAGTVAGGAGNDRGIWIQTGASDNYIITSNLCRGNTTADITDNGTGINKSVANNILT